MSERDVLDSAKGIGTVRAHECVLAVVGSVYRGASPETIAEVKAAIVDAFDRHDPRWVVSGGADGVDSWAAEEASRRFTRTTVAHPKYDRWKPCGFEERNELIALSCEHLVRIYDPASKTYGSGWTADLAEREGRTVERIAIGRAVTTPSAPNESGANP